jgi:hypothetical protein
VSLATFMEKITPEEALLAARLEETLQQEK